jgi:hypothetical protein
MQRVRVSLPYFIDAGWDVTVLTVDDPTPTAPTEPELNETVPNAVQVKRAFCFSRRWTSWFGVNNVALRSLPFLFLAGCQLLSSRRYDVVYFSTTMFIVLPFGRLWKMFYGVPYVIDLQDPWVTDYYERPGSPPPPGGWKYAVARSVGQWLEGWTMRGVAQLIVVSSAYGESMRSRHPDLRTLPISELTFGSPDPDLQHLRATLSTRPPILPAGVFRLAFAGALGPGMLPAVNVLFAAVAEARRGGLPLSVHFHGTSYAPHGHPATLALAREHGILDCVFEQPRRLRYFDALQVSLEAEVNLLLGSTDLAFIPSKILAVLAARRPVLAIAPVGSAMVTRLAQLGQECATFIPQNPAPSSIHDAVSRLQAIMAASVPPVDRSMLVRHGSLALADEQLAILSQAATGCR